MREAVSEVSLVALWDLKGPAKLPLPLSKKGSLFALIGDEPTGDLPEAIRQWTIPGSRFSSRYLKKQALDWFGAAPDGAMVCALLRE